MPEDHDQAFVLSLGVATRNSCHHRQWGQLADKGKRFPTLGDRQHHGETRGTVEVSGVPETRPVSNAFSVTTCALLIVNRAHLHFALGMATSSLLRWQTASKGWGQGRSLSSKWDAAHPDSEPSDLPASTQAMQEKHSSFYCRRSKLYLILPLLEVEVLKYWALLCCISKCCSFSLKGSRPVISFLSTHMGNGAHPLCWRQASCFQAWSVGRLPAACSSCWYRSLSARHSSITRKINVKTSLTASVLFHPATRSLGRGGESPQGDRLTPNHCKRLLFLPVSARGLLSSPLAGSWRGSGPAVCSGGGAPGFSLCTKGWGRRAQLCAGGAGMPHSATPSQLLAQ